jgi:hypothetical protein
MMPIEQQVCSYELAKQLAELGVRQESVFWWVDRKLTYTGGRASHAPRQGGIAAFTAAELGEMLPDEVIIPSKNGKPHTHSPHSLYQYFGHFLSERGEQPRPQTG